MSMAADNQPVVVYSDSVEYDWRKDPMKNGGNGY